MKCFLVTVLCVFLTAAARTDARLDRSGEDFNGKFDGRVLRRNDKGMAKNCGDAQHNFTLQWQPAKIQIGSFITVDFSFDPAEDWDSGLLSVDVWFSAFKQRIFKDKAVTCKQLQSYMPMITRCPLKKGVPLNVHGVKVPVTPPVKIPSGKYRIQASVTNTSRQPLICVDATFTVVNGAGVDELIGEDLWIEHNHANTD